MSVTSLQIYRAMQKLCEYGIEEQEAEHITLSIFKIKEDHLKRANNNAIYNKLVEDLFDLKKEVKSLRKEIKQHYPEFITNQKFREMHNKSLTLLSIFVIAFSPMLIGMIKILSN